MSESQETVSLDMPDKQADDTIKRQVQQIEQVIAPYPFLRGEADERITGIRALSAEEFMMLCAAVNQVVQQSEYAETSARGWLAAPVELPDSNGHLPEESRFRTLTIMPNAQDRYELFEYAKELANDLIDRSLAQGDSYDYMSENLAAFLAKSSIAIHCFLDGNGRTGRVLFYLLAGRSEHIDVAFKPSSRNILHFNPYSNYHLEDFLRTSGEAAWDDILEIEHNLDMMFDGREDSRKISASLINVHDRQQKDHLVKLLQQPGFASLALHQQQGELGVTFNPAALGNAEAEALIQRDHANKVDYIRHVLYAESGLITIDTHS